MGINATSTAAAITNVRYSAFLGMLYVSSSENEAAITEAKGLVGEAEVKKGYTGSKGDSSSAKAIAFLAEKGIKPVKVSGLLTSARVIEREIDGRKTPYLNVGLKDDDGRYFLSVSLDQAAAQMLARKLTAAEPGVDTEISMFATYEKREGAARAYANHGCSLKQNGAEIKGIDVKEALLPRINAAMKALEDAGVNKESDKETFNKRRAKVELEFHEELMTQVNGKFTAYYAQTEQQPEEDGIPA